MAYCPKCGANLPDNAHFCGICGAQLAAQTAQAAPAYGSQQQAYGAQYQQQTYGNQYQQQPQQQSYGGSYQQQAYGAQYQQAPGYSAYLPQQDYGRQKPAKARKKEGPVGLLRLLSFLFAVGLVVLAAGFGSQLYFNRTYTTLHEDAISDIMQLYSSSGKKTVSELDEKLIDKNETEIKALILSAIAEDAKGTKKAAKDLIVRLMKSTDKLSAIYKDEKDEITKALDDFSDALDDKLVREYAKEINKRCGEEFGIRWIIIRISSKATLLMIAGGALAGLALLLWLFLHGPSTGLTRSGFLPALCVAVVLIAAIIILCMFIFEPLSLEDFTSMSTDYESGLSEETIRLREEVSQKWGVLYRETYDRLITRIVNTFLSMIGMYY